MALLDARRRVPGGRRRIPGRVLRHRVVRTLRIRVPLRRGHDERASSPSGAETRTAPGRSINWTRCSGGWPDPDEPSWPSAMGAGRAGWHIECAAIAGNRLGLFGVADGTPIDVQGGGSDLIFPHHECSAAHAEVLSGVDRFAEHYTHAGMIGLDGEKMSKSKRQPGLRVHAACSRASTRWRSGWPCSPATTGRTASGTMDCWPRQGTAGRVACRCRRGLGRPADQVVDGLRAALADDLDTPCRAGACWTTWAAERRLGRCGPLPSPSMRCSGSGPELSRTLRRRRPCSRAGGSVRPASWS